MHQVLGMGGQDLSQHPPIPTRMLSDKAEAGATRAAIPQTQFY